MTVKQSYGAFITSFTWPPQPLDGLCMYAGEQVNEVMSVVDFEVTETFLLDVVGSVGAPRLRKNCWPTCFFMESTFVAKPYNPTTYVPKQVVAVSKFTRPRVTVHALKTK